ncbi:Glycogenin-1 [Quaeritorhiza haematococci]|nr:Glycogenin-1 [Quaeritorhiza haematococci]
MACYFWLKHRYPPFEFNAGVMVINPSKRVFEDMIAKLPDLGSHDCGDQGFLNKYFEIWRDLPSPHHLPNSYNIHVRMLSRLVSNSDIQRNFFNTLDPKILHFSGRFKPWEPSQEIVVDNLALSELWSTTFRNAHPEITRAMITRRQTILNKKQIEIVESLGEILRGVSQMSDLSSLPVAFLGGPRVDEFEDVVHFLGELSALRRLGLEPEIHCVFNHLPTAPSCDLNVLRESIPSDAIVFVHTSFSGASQHQRSASGNTFLLNVTNFFLNHKIVAMDSRSSSSNPTKAHETMERTITDLVQAVESHPALYLIWSDDVAFHSSAASFPSRRSYLLKYLPLLLDVNDTDGPNRNPVDVMTSSSLQNRKVFQEPLVKIRDSKPKRDLSHLDLDTLQNDSDDESKRLREHLEKRDDDREVREGTEEPKTDREQEKDEEQYEVKGDESKGLEIIWSVEYLDTESILSQSLKDVIASLAQSTFMANGTVHPFVVKTMIQRLQQAFRQVVSRMSRAQVWVASDLTTTMLAATLGKPLVILAENDEADIVKRVPFVKDVLNDDDAVFVSLDAREQASVLFNNIIKAFY